MSNKLQKGIATLSSAALVVAGVLLAPPAFDSANTNAAGFEEVAEPSEVAVAAPASDIPAVSEFGGSAVTADDLSFELELPFDKADEIAKLPPSGQNDAIAEAVAEDPVYEVSVEGEKLIVAKPYAAKRIIVDAASGDIDASKADNAVFDAYTNSYILTFPTMRDTADAYESLLAQLGEGSIMVDVPVHALGASAAYDGWGIQDMNLDKAEDALDARTTPQLKVALIDTGLNASHQAFKDVTIDPASGTFMSAKNSATRTSTDFADDNGHGTHVANIVTSATPDTVSLLCIKCLDSNGSGYLYDIYYSLLYAANNGADIVNLSLGADLGTGRSAQSTKTMFDRAVQKVNANGGIVIAASSNEGRDMDERGTYPATSPYAYAVGGLNDDDTRAAYSNYGQSLDFVAPGTSIKSAWKSSTTATRYSSGTSMSAPHVTAFVADLESLYPEKSASEIMELVQSMSVDLGDAGFDIYYGYGKPVFDLSLFDQAGTPTENIVPGTPDTIDPDSPQTPSNEPQEPQPSNENGAVEQQPENTPASEPSNTTVPEPVNENGADETASNENVPVEGPPAEPGNQNEPAEAVPTDNVSNENSAVDAPNENAPSNENGEPAGDNANSNEEPANTEPDAGEQPLVPKKNILNGNFYVSGINASYRYTGNPITPTFWIYEKPNQWHFSMLVEGRDYTVSYSNNVKPGYAKVTITGIGQYEGTAYVYFRIEQARQSFWWPWR